MRSMRCICLLTLALMLTLGFAAHAQTTTTTTTTTTAAPAPAPTAFGLPSGDDGWTTTNDGSTTLRYDLNPIPAGTFGTFSNAVTTPANLSGRPIAGLAGNHDTIVRRLAPTGLMAVGSTATVPIDFQALHLESDPFTVTYSDGSPSETWKIVAGLSTAAAQPIGDMTISRDCNNGGSFSANLKALFVLRYIRVSPPGGSVIVQDCGVGDCPEVLFRTSGAQWTQRSALGTLNIHPLPPGANIDVDADGVPDGVTTIGQSSFQGGIQICGGGGGGSPECARVDHVANDSGPKDHSRSSHGNYAAGGDSDGDGLPDHCACEDRNGDGVDDDGGGHPCPRDEEEPRETDGDVIDSDVDVSGTDGTVSTHGG